MGPNGGDVNGGRRRLGHLPRVHARPLEPPGHRQRRQPGARHPAVGLDGRGLERLVRDGLPRQPRLRRGQRRDRRRELRLLRRRRRRASAPSRSTVRSRSTDDDCVNFNGAGNGGYTYDDYGKVAGGPEVHADGEIWAQTLWELRQRLVAKYGAVAGDARAQTYITRGDGALAAVPVDDRHAQRRSCRPRPSRPPPAARSPAATTTTCCGRRSPAAAWATSPPRSTATTSARSPTSRSRRPRARPRDRSPARSRPATAASPPPARGSRSAATTPASAATSPPPPAPAAATRSPTCRTGPTRTCSSAATGFDRNVTSNVTVNGTTTRNFTTPPQLGAARTAAARWTRSRAPDLSANGCGPGRRDRRRPGQRLGQHLADEHPGPGRRQADHDQAAAGDHARPVRGRSRAPPAATTTTPRSAVLQDRDVDERDGVHPDQRGHVHRHQQPQAQPAHARRRHGERPLRPVHDERAAVVEPARQGLDGHVRARRSTGPRPPTRPSRSPRRRPSPCSTAPRSAPTLRPRCPHGSAGRPARTTPRRPPTSAIACR